MSVYTAVPFLNWGRWVALCPRPGCFNAEQLGQCDDGSIGGLTDTGFTCRTGTYGGCGLQCDVAWPAHLEDIERLVLPRTVPATRNWYPGESLTDLLKENVQQGLVPNDDLEIAGDRIVEGRLTSFSPPELEGGR